MTKDVKYTNDGNWQVEMVAFKINLFFYKAIGSTITVRHMEARRRWWLWWEPPHIEWVKRPADNITINNSFEGILPDTIPGAAFRSCSTSKASRCDCRLWSVGIGISVDASPSPGDPDWGTTRPSSAASLDVRSVRGSGYAVIAGAMIQVGEVRAS